MTKKHILAFSILGTVAVAGWAVSIPNTFTANSAARAADVNANFDALATAVTALEQKVAALEGNAPLTGASVEGSYKVFEIGTKVTVLTNNNVSTAQRRIGVRPSITISDVTFAATGTNSGTLSGTGSEEGTNVQANLPYVLGTFPNTTSAGGSPSHSHGLQFTPEQVNHSVGTQIQTDSNPNQTFSGTWVLNPATRTLTVQVGTEPQQTLVLSKDGHTAYSVNSENSDTSQGEDPGKAYRLMIAIRQ